MNKLQGPPKKDTVGITPIKKGGFDPSFDEIETDFSKMKLEKMASKETQKMGLYMKEFQTSEDFGQAEDFELQTDLEVEKEIKLYEASKQTIAEWNDPDQKVKGNCYAFALDSRGMPHGSMPMPGYTTDKEVVNDSNIEKMVAKIIEDGGGAIELVGGFDDVSSFQDEEDYGAISDISETNLSFLKSVPKEKPGHYLMALLTTTEPTGNKKLLKIGESPTIYQLHEPDIHFIRRDKDGAWTEKHGLQDAVYVKSKKGEAHIVTDQDLMNGDADFRFRSDTDAYHPDYDECDAQYDSDYDISEKIPAFCNYKIRAFFYVKEGGVFLKCPQKDPDDDSF